MESPYKDSWPDMCVCVCGCVCVCVCVQMGTLILKREHFYFKKTLMFLTYTT